MILTRVNTITNVTYSQDPTIFAIELANEPHTTDNYEKNHNMQPGSLIKGWIKEVVAHTRTLDKNHMVSAHSVHSSHGAREGCRLWESKYIWTLTACCIGQQMLGTKRVHARIYEITVEA